MSEQENEIVRRGYKAFSEGDMRTLRNLLAEDVEWHFPPTYAGIPWAQHPWRGWDGYLQANKLLSQFLEFQVYQPDEFIAGGDSVVVLGHERCRLKAGGRIVEASWIQIFTLRDGKISKSREYSDTAAWDNGYRGPAWRQQPAGQNHS